MGETERKQETKRQPSLFTQTSLAKENIFTTLLWNCSLFSFPFYASFVFGECLISLWKLTFIDLPRKFFFVLTENFKRKRKKKSWIIEYESYLEIEISFPFAKLFNKHRNRSKFKAYGVFFANFLSMRPFH